ncbi:MAG: hypothetical protein K0R41_3966 [Geminicoccaceae bacterium]|jgi:plasmid maintenance system antidote protein VapI|nr:hypothetical protein [Geminicoccaceae bacterium]MDF3042857.1 hypothetical protein [Thermomicrobiales bacterium]
MSSISTSSNTIEAPPLPGMPPVHPGLVLAEILLDHGLSGVGAARSGSADAAAAARRAAETERRDGVPARALCGNGPEIWLNLQAQYDLALARERSAAQIEAVEPLVESVGQLSQNLNPGDSRVRIRDPVSGCLGRSS